MDLLARFVCSWMVFVIYIEVGVEGVAFAGTCTNDGDCTEANTVCTTSKCACSTDSFRKDGTECATKIALAGTCTATPTDQCADSNTKCHATDLKCVCTSNYFADKNGACAAQVAALDGACDASDSASDQCAVADSECRNDGTNKCLCKATHYVNGAACAIRVAYDGTCSANGDCAEVNNVCTSSKCACSTDSFRKDGTACATKIALTGTCSASPPDQCASSNAECHTTELTCRCKDKFFETKARVCAGQVAALDGPCDVTDPASDQCAVAHSECRTNGTDKCLCKATHYTAKGACITRKNPKASCGGDECITHASCVSTKCVCDAGYIPLPTTSPSMCSGVVKITNLPYMYVIPILVSVMFLLRSSVNVYS